MLLPLLLALASQSTPPAASARVESHGLWSLGFSGYRRMAPADELVVLSQTDGVYGNDAATGESRWARQDLARDFGVPTVGGARVYVGAAQGADSKVTTEQATFALDLASGATRWKSTFWAYEGVAEAGERVVGIGTTECGGKLAVVALRASDGEVAWSTPLDDLWKTAPRPRIAGDLLVCRGRESIAVLRASDGAVAWRRPAASEGWLECGARGDVVVLLGAAGEREGRARGMSAAKGEILWTVPLSAPATGLAFAGDDVLVASWNGVVVLIDSRTGKERWRAKLASGSSGDPLVVGDVVLARLDGRGENAKSNAWTAIDLSSGALRGPVLEVHPNDTLIVDGRARLWWSRPGIGKLEALELRRVP